MAVNLDKYVKSKRGKRVFLRRILKGLLLVVGLWLVFILMSRALRRTALTQIAELTNTKIEAYSVDFNLNGSVFIEQLIIRPNQEHKYDDAILKAETVYARFGVGSLLLLRPRLKEINVGGFVFNVQYDLDTGRWNVGALKIKAPKGGSGEMPLVRLEKGVLQYSKVSKGQSKAIATVPIDARLGPAEKTQDSYSFNITTAQRAGSDKSTLRGSWQRGRITAGGEISSVDTPAFEKGWVINALDAELNYDRNNTYSLKLKIKDLMAPHRSATETFASGKPSFWEKPGLFTALQRFFSRYRPAGRVDIDLEASGNLGQLSESTLVGKVYCKDASICDRKFTYPIEQLTGQIDFTENGAVLNNLRGKHSDVGVVFNGWSKGFGAKWQYEIAITSNNMALDNELYNALSTKQKKFWSAFSPSGLAAIDYRLSRRSRTDKKKTLAVELLDAEATYRHFPYPLKNLTGKLFFDRDSVIVSDVVSQVKGREININGKVTDRRVDRPIYDISIIAKDIPLDSTLAAALAERPRHLYNQFHLAGLADAEVKIFTPKQDLNTTSIIADGPNYMITVDCLGNSAKFEQFPYPLKDITGRVTIRKSPDIIKVKLEDITATAANDAGETAKSPTIKLNGRIALADDTSGSGRFELCASDITLTADNLRIKGKSLTEVKADIHYDDQQQKWLSKNLIADCYGGRLTGKFELAPAVLLRKSKVAGETTLKYLLQTGFDRIDLKQFLADTTKNSKLNGYTSGEMSGSLSLSGVVGESLPRMGRCRLKIIDMQVGKLSPLAKLLYVLKLTEPKDFAFDRMLVDSYIKHDRLFFEQLDLSGEAVAFTGSGWMELQSRNVDLTLTARGRRVAAAEPSILQSLTEGLGGAVVRMEVTGNVYDPQVETRTLPVIEQTLQILGTAR